MQRLLIKRFNRNTQRNRYQHTELSFSPILGMHPSSDFGEYRVREMPFFNFLGSERHYRASLRSQLFGKKRLTQFQIKSTAFRTPGFEDERWRLNSFGLDLAPDRFQHRHNLHPILRRAYFMRRVLPPRMLFQTEAERRLRPSSNRRYLHLHPKMAKRPKKWLSRWRKHQAWVRRQRNLVNFLRSHLSPQMAGLRGR